MLFHCTKWNGMLLNFLLSNASFQLSFFTKFLSFYYASMSVGERVFSKTSLRIFLKILMKLGCLGKGKNLKNMVFKLNAKMLLAIRLQDF